MKIGVFTYEVPHRKTYDTLCMLKAKGYNNVCVYGIPMHYKKKFHSLIQHRPTLLPGVIKDTKEFCENLEFDYLRIENYEEVDLEKETIILVCGAGIIPYKYIEKYIIVNAHPGYIPNVRGLDSLKWAIYEKEPIGVTTHILGREVDAGYIIERKKLELNEYDTFHSIAQRQYELEIKMLVDAIEKVRGNLEYVTSGNFKLHKRMGHEQEKELYYKFDEYIQDHKKLVGGGITNVTFPVFREVA